MGRDAIVGSDGIIERKKEDGDQKRIRKRIGEREKKIFSYCNEFDGSIEKRDDR